MTLENKFGMASFTPASGAIPGCSFIFLTYGTKANRFAFNVSKRSSREAVS